MLTPEPTPGPRRDHQTQACRNLWAEVFKLGIQDAAVAASRGNFNYPWFMSDAVYPGSFVWLCNLFELAPEITRSTLRGRFRAIIREAKYDDR